MAHTLFYCVGHKPQFDLLMKFFQNFKTSFRIKMRSITVENASNNHITLEIPAVLKKYLNDCQMKMAVYDILTLIRFIHSLYAFNKKKNLFPHFSFRVTFWIVQTMRTNFPLHFALLIANEQRYFFLVSDSVGVNIVIIVIITLF
jgi:hypothetical protein